MTIYLLQVFLLIILGKILNPNKSLRTRKIYININFIIIILISGFRGKLVGADTLMYYKAFIYISKTEFINIGKFRYEYGFSFLCKLLSTIYNDPQILLVITSVFIMGVVGFFIYKNSEDIILSCYIFITLNIYFFYMTAMRQAIAIAIILIGYEYLKKNKRKKYLIFVIIASLFHQSALICLIFLILNDKKYKIRNFILTILGAIISFISFNYLFEIFVVLFKDYEAYSSGIFSVSNYFGALIEAIIIIFIWIFGIYNLILKEKKDINKNTSFLAHIISLATIFSVLVIKMNVVNRIVPYFTIFNILWLPKILVSIKNTKIRLTSYICVYFLLFIYWFTILITRPEWFDVIPYKIFFIN